MDYLNDKCILECSSDCKSCKEVGKCTSCFEKKFLHEGSCIGTCPESFYQLEDKCVVKC